MAFTSIIAEFAQRRTRTKNACCVSYIGIDPTPNYSDTVASYMV
ncbi:hypothetical protein [Sphingobacterium gobiense]|nr:hypothetical protein [Sphingobacterium gobiense]